MPIECTRLYEKPQPYRICPKCHHAPFEAFIRGCVQSWWRSKLGMKYCAVICNHCKAVVGWEKPDTSSVEEAGS